MPACLLTGVEARLAENASRIDAMMDSMSEEELFQPHRRKWADDAQNSGVGGLQVHSCEDLLRPSGRFRTKDSKVEKVGDVNFNRTKK